jgi:hypothetical protein
MQLTKKEWFILGGGVVAGLILAAMFRANKDVSQTDDKDAEYFAFSDGGIKLGDKGTDVNRLKTVINHFGYNMPIDGLYNRETKKIIMSALNGTKFINNKRNEGEVDARFVNGMERIFENVNKRQL